LIAVACCLLSASACHKSSSLAPTVPLDQRFTLAPGETVSIRDSEVRFEFLRVSGDSRCPADAVCIQGGDALVHVRATHDARTDYELHTGDESQSTIVHAGLRLTLIELQPYPFSSRTIQPGEYRATFTVGR
jgi:hypothetical protein